VYFRLPVFGIPIVALSGSVPLFALTRPAKQLCLSVTDDLYDLKIIHGGDLIGDFPMGFKIHFSWVQLTFQTLYTSSANA
jgi:hypothetical protein